MKKVILLSIVALVCSISVVANSVVLRRRAMYQHGGMRMPSVTQVEADFENGFLTVNVQKYSGMIWVYIYDADGSIIGENATNIISDGSVTAEVNPLKKGVYTLSVVLNDTIYEGTFEIP